MTTRAFLLVIVMCACGSNKGASPAAVHLPHATPQDASLGVLVRARPGTDLAAFSRGRVVFEREFTLADGLGPNFNGNSCASCHAIPSNGGAGDYEHRVYSQPRFTSRGATSYTAQQPYRLAPSLFGIGYLNDVRDAEIRSGCGLDARLGIHGVASEVTQPHGRFIMRFGKKLRSPDVFEFVSTAFFEEMGVNNTSSLGKHTSASGEPLEIDDASMRDLVTFVRGLEAIPPLTADPAGRQLFVETGCATCHRLDRLGTDLCLHDMGEGLRQVEEVRPGDEPNPGNETRWATAHLNGIRYRRTFLHDGRVTTVDQSVRAHGGEAAMVVNAYLALAPESRSRLLEFVHGL